MCRSGRLVCPLPLELRSGEVHLFGLCVLEKGVLKVLCAVNMILVREGGGGGGRGRGGEAWSTFWSSGDDAER